MSTEALQFSVVIPTYARPKRLAACLNSLTKLQFPRDQFEVIVVDDGSPKPPDDTVEPFRGGLRLSLIRQANAGPAAARNAGAARATGRYLAFTDDDCEPNPNWLTTLAERMRQSPQTLVGGRIVNGLPENFYSAASQAITDCTYDRMQRRGGELLFATCNIAVCAASFRKLGGFSTGFPLAAGEDYDFCHRWQHEGFAAVYAPEVIVQHSHHLTLAKFLKQHFSYGRGLFQFRRRAGGVVGALRHGRTSLYLDLLRWPLLHGRGLAAWKLTVLVGLSQLATAAGAARELFSRAPATIKSPVDLQKELR